MSTKVIELFRYSIYFFLVFASSFIVVPSLSFGARFVFGIFMAYSCMRGAALLYADTIGRKDSTNLGPLGYDPTSVKDNPGLLIPTTDLRAKIRIIAGLDLPRKITSDTAVTGKGLVGGADHTPDRAPAAPLEFIAGTASTQTERVRQAFEGTQVAIGSSISRVISLDEVQANMRAIADAMHELGNDWSCQGQQHIQEGQGEGLIAALDLRPIPDVSRGQEGC